jgi:LemA protein
MSWQSETTMKILLVVLGILLLVGLAFGGKFISVRNDLATQQEAIQAAWAQVDVALQRRADLIPNLVNTVKGFAAQEKAVIDSVTSARAQLVGARTPEQRMAANAQLDSALSRLLVVVENYPQLKSNENFLRLQDELAGTENRIAVERRKYNEAVQRYNTQIRLFPNNVIASIAGFESNPYFKTDPGSRAVPQVQF